jgi:hypothetical protein
MLGRPTAAVLTLLALLSHQGAAIASGGSKGTETGQTAASPRTAPPDARSQQSHKQKSNFGPSQGEQTRTSNKQGG